MDTDSFIVYIKPEYYEDIVEDVEIRFDTSNQIDLCLKEKMKK